MPVRQERLRVAAAGHHHDSEMGFEASKSKNMVRKRNEDGLEEEGGYQRKQLVILFATNKRNLRLRHAERSK